MPPAALSVLWGVRFERRLRDGIYSDAIVVAFRR
jgi:hypothetical protein